MRFFAFSDFGYISKKDIWSFDARGRKSALKSILLIHGSLEMGGIETLIVRVAEAWAKKGVQVSVLLFSRSGDAELKNRLQRVARIHYLIELVKYRFMLTESVRSIHCLMPLKMDSIKRLMRDVDHIHFFDSLSLVFCHRLVKASAIPLKISGGVYFQHEYSYKLMQDCYFVRTLSRMFFCIPSKNILFFNEISKKHFEQLHSVAWPNTKVAPIGVDVASYRMRDVSAVNKNRIVSIGRVTAFKTYNFEFISSLERLTQVGFNFTYHIYGDGPEIPALKRRIQSSAVSDRVFLHGKAKYSEFAEIVANSLLFIGSGTALIEAAACGVPALVGIESENSENTYGFLHSLEGLSYQENGIREKSTTYTECCLWLYGLSNSGYKDVCESSFQKAQQFSLENLLTIFDEMDKFAGYVEHKEASFSNLRFGTSLLLNRLISGHNPRSYWQRSQIKSG